ncbi:MAG: hypothetical protein V2I46_09660 [Bacteroides sp.]|nr:hypothetical protein [Bacteroides sp.]
MKTLYLLPVLALAFTLTTGHAQKVKTYKAWVTFTDDIRIRGTFYSAETDGLILMGDDLNEIRIDPKTVKTISFRRKGSVGKGVWIGALSGAAVGAIAGYASGDDEPGWFSSTAEEKAAGGAIFLSFPGAGIGALFGSKRTIYPINGDYQTYSGLLAELKKYSPSGQ